MRTDEEVLKAAKEALSEAGWLSADGGLFCNSPYIGWSIDRGRKGIVLDGEFTLAELYNICTYITITTGMHMT